MKTARQYAEQLPRFADFNEIEERHAAHYIASIMAEVRAVTLAEVKSALGVCLEDVCASK